MKKQWTEVNIDDVVVRQPLRQSDGDLGDLESSVRRLGLLCPIIIDRNGVLISGGRRLKACRAAGLMVVPALRVDVDHDSLEALSVRSDDNLCRQALSNEDLERNMQAKKSLVASQADGPGNGSSMLAGLKRILLSG